tara:strand:+ start:1134 stop:2132 length:999 start_codon:yes stop_codon:yes gene_type:complete
MPSLLPFKTAIGIGVESTRGTAVSRTNFLEVSSAEFTETATYERFPVQQAAHNGSRQISFITRKQVTGTIVVPLQYTGSGILLKNLLGAVSTAADGGAFNHTYDLGAVPPEFLTIEKIIGTSGRRELITGACVSAGRIRFRRAQVTMMELDIIGFKSDGYATAPTPTFGAAVQTRAALSRHLTASSGSGSSFQFSWNSSHYATATEVTVNVDSNVSDVGSMGSFFTAGVDQGGERVISVTMSLRHEGQSSEVFYTDHLAETSGGLSFAMVGDSANQQITFTGRNAKITNLPAPPLSGDSRVIIRPTWTLHDDASNGALSIVVKNASSSHSAN